MEILLFYMIIDSLYTEYTKIQVLLNMLLTFWWSHNSKVRSTALWMWEKIMNMWPTKAAINSQGKNEVLGMLDMDSLEIWTNNLRFLHKPQIKRIN